MSPHHREEPQGERVQGICASARSGVEFSVARGPFCLYPQPLEAAHLWGLSVWTWGCRWQRACLLRLWKIKAQWCQAKTWVSAIDNIKRKLDGCAILWESWQLDNGNAGWRNNQFFTSQRIYLGEFNPASKGTEVSMVPTRIIYGPLKVLVASPYPKIS